MDDDWEDEGYHAGRTCAVCGYRILDNSTIPTCSSCGWKIAQAFASRILAEGRAKHAEAIAARRERTAPRVPPAGGWVYYVRINDYIKIGFTTQLTTRMRQLRVDWERDFLAAEEGPPELERERHREFRGDRVHARREDFRPSDRLLAHIDKLRQENPRPRGRPNTARITHRRLSP